MNDATTNTGATMTKRQAIGYVRVSTEDQATEGISLAAQRERIIGYCQAFGLELADIHSDEGISGKTITGRPGLLAALAAVKAVNGELVVVKLDRLSRSTRDCLDLVERADAEAWGLRSIVENLDTSSPHGRFAVTILAAVSQLERERIGENTRLALDKKRRDGHKLGRVPFGKVAVEVEGVRVLEDDPKTAPIVRRMVEEHAAGRSFGAIARGLNDDAIATMERGGKWSHRQVSRIVARAKKEAAAA